MYRMDKRGLEMGLGLRPKREPEQADHESEHRAGGNGRRLEFLRLDISES